MTRKFPRAQTATGTSRGDRSRGRILRRSLRQKGGGQNVPRTNAYPDGECGRLQRVEDAGPGEVRRRHEAASPTSTGFSRAPQRCRYQAPCWCRYRVPPSGTTVTLATGCSSALLGQDASQPRSRAAASGFTSAALGYRSVSAAAACPQRRHRFSRVPVMQPADRWVPSSEHERRGELNRRGGWR